MKKTTIISANSYHALFKKGVTYDDIIIYFSRSLKTIKIGGFTMTYYVTQYNTYFCSQVERGNWRNRDVHWIHGFSLTTTADATTTTTTATSATTTATTTTTQPENLYR